MGALDEGHCNVELENRLKLSGIELDFEQEPETIAIKDAVKVLLQGLGEDINREGIRKTPIRVAKALREGTIGYRQKAKDIVQSALFPEAGLHNGMGQAGGAGGLVIVRDLDLFSYCESCLLPFQVKCHVGYVPSGQRVVGLSKLSRVADVFAKRLQSPQRLAGEVCSALHQDIKPAGVAIVLQCLHIHFPKLESVFLESSHNGWVSSLQVKSGAGVFENEDADIWVDFFSLLKVERMNESGQSQSQCSWCPSLCSKPSSQIEPLVNSNIGMVSAVSSILMSLGEDPLRKELIGTPTRFVKWLMNFENCNVDMKLNGSVYHKRDAISISEEEICSELNLPFWSQCEHHLLPFHGVVHIGYFCGKGFNPLGKALLQSIVHFYGFKLQVQERLTRQIADAVSLLLGGGVMVVVEANHTCMISRGIEKFGSSTATVAHLGRFSTEAKARAVFLQSVSNNTSMVYA